MGAQPARESHLDLGVDLRLTDAVNEYSIGSSTVMDVSGVVIETLECRVQRRRLA